MLSATVPENRKLSCVTAVAEPHAVEPHRAACRRQLRGRHRLGYGGAFVEDAGELLQGGGRGLERVVELRQLLHRLEEPPQVQQERRQHADLQLAVDGPGAAVEQHDGDGDVAEQPDARAVDRDQPERAFVGPPVRVVDPREDRLVARLAAERVDGADAAERLDEVHDDQRHRLAAAPVRGRGVAPEPPRQPQQRREAGQRHEPERQVEQQDDDADADDRQHRGDQAVEAGVEQLVDGVDVGRQPGDGPARGVGLVERQAQPLEVVEHPLPQVEQHRLADAPRHDEERPPQPRLRRRGHEQQHDDGDEGVRRAAAGDRRDAVVDAELDEVRPGHRGGVLHEDHHDEQPDRALVRREQRTQQPPRPGAQQQRDVGREVVVALVRDAAPLLDGGRVRRGGRWGGQGHAASASADRMARYEG
jgi:hypothetical protein